jgi:hypothetical protein
MKLKGHKLATVFLGTAEICQLFYLATKLSQHIVFHLVFNADSKMGSAILYFKRYCKKKKKNSTFVRFSVYYLNIPV